jgi:hypothetical protein
MTLDKIICNDFYKFAAVNNYMTAVNNFPGWCGLRMPRHSNNQGWILSVGAFVGGELYLSWMQLFPSPLLPLFFFLLQGLTRGHCLGVVTRVDSVTHEYFRRNDKASS